MPVDLEFELTYLLEETLDREVKVTKANFDSSRAMLCVEALVGGLKRSACIEVKACRGLSGGKSARCIVKTLQSREDLLKRLAESLAG